MTDGVFHGALGVLMSVAMHYPNCDFQAIKHGYAAGWSPSRVRELGQRLEPGVMAVSASVTADWVKMVRHAEKEVPPRDGDDDHARIESVAASSELALALHPTSRAAPSSLQVWTDEGARR